jgi:hypothetical protein
MTDKPETKMQRIQRLQAERLEQMARGAVETPKLSSDAPVSLPDPTATPSSTSSPDPQTLRRLHWDRISAKDGAAMQIARTFIVTLVQPMIDKLRAEAKEHPEPFKAELVFWADCLCAGVFPHAPPKPNRELSDFESWFYSSIPTIDDAGVIQSWRTLS